MARYAYVVSYKSTGRIYRLYTNLAAAVIIVARSAGQLVWQKHEVHPK